MSSHSNILSIRQRGKAIPYGGDGVIREDGDANYGFKFLKGDSEGLRRVPELSRDLHLCRLAEAINGPETGLFSVGCVSAPVSDDNGFRHTGYIEFCFNSKTETANAASYFPVFFHFDRFLHEAKFEVPVSFHWQIEGAEFIERDHSGFTISVYLNTHFSPSQAEADENWEYALEALGYYLQSVTSAQTDYIYPQ